MASEKILGIDLGTTNSAFAVMEADDPEIIANSEGDRTTPSVVKFEEDGNRLIGKPAKNQAIQSPDRTIQSIKRHMGEDDYTVEVDDEEYTPEEISAMILQKIKDDAEEYLGEEVEKAVITVPAYFSDNQRQATRDAGEIAGFEVERIVNEPTAAAMAYGIDEEDDQTILVFDLGGGTFDVSVLDIGGGLYEVAATNGDNELGGDDWDQAIIDFVVEEFKDENGVDLSEDRPALQRLREAAEQAKIDLSNSKETQLSLPFVTATDEGPIHLEQTLTRAKFESLTSDLLERTREPTNIALEDAGYEAEEIDEVLLVGGSTRMPQVKEHVEEILGMEPTQNVNPDEAVALGAAVQGGVLGEDVEDIVLLDVTPLSLGVETKGGLFERLIEKNTTIPTKASKTFTTAEDNQTSVQVSVYQGEREIAEENDHLGKFDLRGIAPAPAGRPEIQVTFDIDENGIVNVSARDKASDKTEEITIEGGAGLSEEEIERLQEEAEEYKQQDEERRKIIDAKNTADETISSAETMLENRDVPEDQRQEVEEQLDLVREIKNEDDIVLEELKTETRELGQLVQDVGYEVDSQESLEE